MNGGPSRFYELFLRAERDGRDIGHPSFVAITGDGNFLPEPVLTESIFLGVAQRVDVILDFSAFRPGDHVYVYNLLEQINGAGPSGRLRDFGDPATHLLRFDVVPSREPDRSRIPDFLRPLPRVDLSEVRRERTWVFDYMGGLWTINGRVMDHNRIDAGIEQGSAEIWTLRNGGRNWSHPIHSHYVEFILLEVNGRPYRRDLVQDIEGRAMELDRYLGQPPAQRRPIGSFMGGQRRDVAILLPSDEVKVFMRWPDFLGKYVMHCHNVVHEDHAMMIRWDVVEPGKGFDTPKSAAEIADLPPPDPPHLEVRPGSATSKVMEDLRRRVFADRVASHKRHESQADCSLAMLRYGNAAVGLWGAVPAQTDPEWIARRLSWVTAREPVAGPPRRRGPLPFAASALLLALLLSPTASPAQTPQWAHPPCPYSGSPTYPDLPGVCHPYPQPWPQVSKQTTTCPAPTRCRTVVETGEGIFPPSNPFHYETFPGTNFLPTIYTNMFDSQGNEMPNTLPSIPDNPYNLHDGDPVVSRINPLSPEDDLKSLFDEVLRLTAEDSGGTTLDTLERDFRRRGVASALASAMDILEGNPVPNRVYSGLPLLHYTGPEKARKVTPIKDPSGKVIGGNVNAHQIWYGQRIESDVGFLDLSEVQDVPWTVTYTVDVLSRGKDDFSPFAIFVDITKKPHVGMDQSFFNMEVGTRTIFRIQMPPGRYLNMIYTWGWRMHPPRVQVMENAAKVIDYGDSVPPACPADYRGLSLPQIEQKVFCPPNEPACTSVRCRPDEPRFGPNGKPTPCEQKKLHAIAQIGDLAPEKRMWSAAGEVREAAGRGDFATVRELVQSRALPAYWDFINRNQLPAGVPKDPESDITVLFVNNTTYAELTDGEWGRWDAWEERPRTLKAIILNGDRYVHAYTVADFGGNRGWENQFKSSVKVAGSGCWFTFGRAHWWVPAGGPLNPFICVPAAGGNALGVHSVQLDLHFEPSRRLRFYQFDQFHHDVAIYSVH